MLNILVLVPSLTRKLYFNLVRVSIRRDDVFIARSVGCRKLVRRARGILLFIGWHSVILAAEVTRDVAVGGLLCVLLADEDKLGRNQGARRGRERERGTPGCSRALLQKVREN